jgi:hypothetical protein
MEDIKVQLTNQLTIPNRHGGICVLTTNHVASSYGQPVLVIDGHAYGPGDMLAGGPLLIVSQQGEDSETIDIAAAAAADIFSELPEVTRWNSQVVALYTAGKVWSDEAGGYVAL